MHSCTCRAVEKFREKEKETCRRMFGHRGTDSTNGSKGQAKRKDDDEDENYISLEELKKIKHIYTERFRYNNCFIAYYVFSFKYIACTPFYIVLGEKPIAIRSLFLLQDI